MGTIETYVEIPIKVYYTAYPAEGDGRNEPKTPAGIDIDEIEICAKITDYILEHHGEALDEECADDALPDPGDPDERDARYPFHDNYFGETGGS